MGEQLKDDKEDLFRHIHPEQYDKCNDPTSQAFLPTKKDADRLSVDRASLTTAETSLKLFRKNGGTADEVYALTVGQFRANGIPCVGDPIEGNGKLPNQAHAYADFGEYGSGQKRNKARRLKEAAIARGKVYPLLDECESDSEA